jgi:hypothetical protein
VLMPVADEMNDVDSLRSRTLPNMERKAPSCSAAHWSGISRKRGYPDSALVSDCELHEDTKVTAVKLEKEQCSATS